MSITATRPLAFSGFSPDDAYRLTVPEYHELIRLGILGEGAPVELLDGCLTKKMSKNPPHRGATVLLQQALGRHVPLGYHFELQDPITLSESEPEPDASVIRGDVRDFLDRHPGPEDIALVVEIANNSLTRDRNWKRSIYARAGIPTFWLINLVNRSLEIYSEPAEGDFTLTRILKANESAPLVLDGRDVASIPVRDLLP